MDEREKKSFDFAADLAKQLITLSTGTIALTTVFSRDFVALAKDVKIWALFAWIAFLISIVFGIWTMMALTGTLGDPSTTAKVYRFNIKLPVTLQIIFFLIGLVLAILFGSKVAV
jgi:hypothetical protein